MNQEQMKGLLRGLIGFIGGIVVSRGWVKAEDIQALLSNEAAIGIIITLATLGWGWLARTNKNLTLAVTALPETKAVITSPEIAAATPEAPNVVASVDALPASAKF